MLDIYLNLLMMAFEITVDLYVFCGAILYVLSRNGLRDTNVCRYAKTGWKCTKPLAFIGTLAMPVLTVIVDGHLSWHTYFASAVNVWAWYTFRNAGDDDFTKKLKKKLKEKIAVFRSKLVVVPEAA